MWKPYLRVIRDRCPNALNILDRFHIVAKMNDALDDVRAAEARRLAREDNTREAGCYRVLCHSRSIAGWTPLPTPMPKVSRLRPRKGRP